MLFKFLLSRLFTALAVTVILRPFSSPSTFTSALAKAAISRISTTLRLLSCVASALTSTSPAASSLAPSAIFTFASTVFVRLSEFKNLCAAFFFVAEACSLMLPSPLSAALSASFGSAITILPLLSTVAVSLPSFTAALLTRPSVFTVV